MALGLALSLPTVFHAQASPSLARPDPVSSVTTGSPITHSSSAGQLPAQPHLLPGNQPWQSLGPNAILTPQFGAVTGRVTALAIAPWDASGNTVYLGATGGGVWLSTNAAATDPATVMWRPLTDNLPAFSGINIVSLSIGAIAIQPGTSLNDVILAGTGDPNGAPDSYYGAGILRSTDGGTTWSLIRQSSDGFAGGLTNYSFAGNAFSGFAWSTTNPSLAVAAVTTSFDGFINNINNSGTHNVAEAGLYYSPDAGQTWYLATIEDGPNKIIQSAQTTNPSAFPGVPVSAVVWNPARQMFYAAIQYHGYYQSADGITWMRLAHQPGTALSSTNCPANPGFQGARSCTIFRGALAVNPSTGDMFALTVDADNNDQGIWQDICNAGASGCANPVQFGVRIPDAPLDDSSGHGTIPQGTYNLALTAVPNGTDTELIAGTADIFTCSLAAGCVWRNTTNTSTCVAAQVASAQHAIAGLGAPAGQTLPLLYFGNDGGLWRSMDGIAQTGATCTAGDAAHFQNLNGNLGSLSEVTGLANDPTNANVLLAGFGVNGSAATSNMGATAWQQVDSGFGGATAMDPANPDNWYATVGTGVAVGRCTRGVNCTAADSGSVPAIGPSQTANDQSLLSAPYLLDPADSANLIAGTCRVWRGTADGSGWSAANAISPMLDGHPEPNCNGNALIRSLSAGGPNMQPGTGAQNAGSQMIYAGMAGLLDGGGGIVAGHVFSTTAANLANGSIPWTDLAHSPVANEQSYGGIFNPYYFDVSSLYADPHDPTGNTIYATVQGFGVPHLYYSTNGGANWTNITKNLPDLPLNDVLVDPNNANVVYVASDGGVFVAQNIADCTLSGGQCWNPLGTGLPLSPAVKLSATSGNGGLLRVGTYGRGIWQTPLLSGTSQTAMSLSPTSLTFGSQPVQTQSSPQAVTVTNTGSSTLTVSRVAIAGDFIESDTCSGGIAPGGTCSIQVRFTPAASGARTGTLTVSANIPNGSQTVSLSGTGSTQSAIVLLPNSVDFGSVPVQTTSPTQQVTVSNTSGGAIALTSESASGPFSIQTNTCLNSLPAQTGCTLAIVFQPVQTGPAQGTLTVVSGQGTETIALSGTGANAATDVLAPLSLNFPATAENTASAPQTVTLTNNGGVPLTGIQVQSTGDFAVVSGCGYSLNAQSSCTLTVTYTPHAAGAESGSITVTDALHSQVVTLTGTGIAPAMDTLSPTSLLFPATVIGQSATPQTILLANSGGSSLQQIHIQAAGAGFSETNTCGATLAPSTSCTITVSFLPTVAGNATGQVVVSDALRTQVVPLSGEGETLSEDNLSPLMLNFGNQTVGTASTAQQVTLTNHGQSTLTGIRIQSPNPDYMFTTNCGNSLVAGQSCSIFVVFEPHTTGSSLGILTVADVLQTQQVQLLGNGTLANVTLTPGSADFGTTGINISSAPQTFLLSNGSPGTLRNIALQLAPPFSATTNCGPSLNSGTSCSYSVVFTPTATGAQHGTLTISSADIAPLTASLTGIGIAFNLIATTATFQTISSGGTAQYGLQVVPVNGSQGQATLQCSNAPPSATCSITPATVDLSGPSNVQVVIATGVGASGSHSMQMRSAGFACNWSWPFGFVVIFLPFISIRFRCSRRNLRQVLLLTLVVLLLVLTGMTACGRGGGPLGSNSNPLPGSSITPPGTYTVTVSALAGGMQKSINLTVQVQ
jgi:hypothetical protein